MTATLQAWQCIGCGKLEAPQNCIGVCQDRRVELVYASEYEAVAAELARACAERDALAALARRVAALEAADAAMLVALRDEARAVLARPQQAVPSEAPPAGAAGPLRDRRSGAASAVPHDIGTDAQSASGTAASPSPAARQSGDKPQPRQPATLYVR